MDVRTANKTDGSARCCWGSKLRKQWLHTRRVRASLSYANFGIINHAGFVYCNARYQPTYVYDVDPTLGNTAVPGLAEWGGIYRFYRVRGSRIIASFSNKETFPVTCYICPVNIDPGANTTSYAKYISNRLGKSQSIGPLTGNGNCVLTSSVTTADFAGVPDTQQLDNYCAPTSGSSAPLNNYFWIVGIVTDGTVMSAGFNLNVRVEMDVEFFELDTPVV